MSKTFSKVFERDNHRCVYCGKDMLSDLDTFMSVEEDHLLPKSAGGDATDPANIVTSCNVCNRLKGNFKPESIQPSDRGEYLAAVRAKISSRREQKLKEFLSWAIPDEKDYHT